ncbi:MAG: glycosyltransferase [Lachnospiraceae bacterium]|nr:glycosyltransferase [Lachnospiraceae bacterium]
MKLLTVTVPCYNSQDYVENCLKSLLPGGDRLEIIIIDDGSTDATGRIADEYAARYPDMIRVIHQENGGHGEGINQGLKAATGKYFRVVDSDDTLSADLPAYLDKLEECDAQGVDLLVTNYYYVHSDGKGDRSINFSNALKENCVMEWKDTKRFLIDQILMIHAVTFRTEVMRRSPMALPKHVFYEDNLMVYKTLPFVKKLMYMNVDLYRYWIGRPDQSVQRDVSMRRYKHQVQVTEMCFQVCHLDDIKEKRLKQYLKHEMFMMFCIAITMTRLNKSEESDAALDGMWRKCFKFDKKWAKRYRWASPLVFLSFKGKFGQNLSCFFYDLANKVVRFN